MLRSPVNVVWKALWLCAGLMGIAHADTLLDATSMANLSTFAAPSQRSFPAANQALTVTLTDLQQPAAFTSLQIAVTLNDTLVGQASVDTTHTASVAVPAAASGTYVLYVIGTPATAQPFGSFGVCVSAASDTTNACIAADSFSGNITTPTAASSSASSTLDTSFASTAAGTYTVTLTDAAFPAALNSLSAIVTQGSTQIGGVISAGVPAQLTLAADTTYTLLVAAQASAGLPAGLYAVHITGPSGTVVFDHSFPVGGLGSATEVANPVSNASLTLTVTAYAYPAALASVGAAVTSGGVVLGSLTAAGSLPLTGVPAGTLEIWTYAAPGAEPGVYGLTLAGASTLYTTTQVANPAGTSAASFAFVANIPSMGTYNLAVNDFGFPTPLSALTATVAQGGTVLTQTSSGNFTAAAGIVIVLVNATPPQSGDGIFGVTVESTAATPQILLDQTQAVGGTFSEQVLSVGTSGGYQVSLSDLAFPAAFQSLAVVVSQGSQVLGKIYANGSFPLTVTPGQYVLTFIATPAAAQGYGLYGVDIAAVPPTVTLTAASSSVMTGETVQLTWSSTNASSCSASGATGWAGSEPVSGSLAVTISATSTLSLTCTGPGGSATQSVSVTATAVQAKSGGGGGGIDRALLWVLASLAGAKVWRTRFTRRL